jgi:hypothetical protein
MSGNNHLIVDEGDTRRVTMTFANAAGVLTNPITVTWAQRTPTQTETGGTAVTAGWTNVSAGVYTREVAFTVPGLYFCEARDTGNGVDQREMFTIEVRRSMVRV